MDGSVLGQCWTGPGSERASKSGNQMLERWNRFAAARFVDEQMSIDCSRSGRTMECPVEASAAERPVFLLQY